MTDRDFQEFVIKHLTALTEGQEKLRQDLARMEFAYGEKLSALFDGYQQNAVVLADHTQRLERIEDKITTHEIQIKVLDSTKSNKRKIK